MRLLLAEDDGVLSCMLGLQLANRGLTIAGMAADGLETVTLCQALRPDVVLMDIDMPGMDGISATRKIMNDCPTCVVILTALTDEHTRIEATGAGAMGYLSKPIQLDDLLKELETAQAKYQEFYGILSASNSLASATRIWMVVEQAKCCLEAGQCSPASAFDYLSARAGEHGCSLLEEALAVIATKVGN